MKDGLLAFSLLEFLPESVIEAVAVLLLDVEAIEFFPNVGSIRWVAVSASVGGLADTE
jgi:hypothetical protein